MPDRDSLFELIETLYSKVVIPAEFVLLCLVALLFIVSMAVYGLQTKNFVLPLLVVLFVLAFPVVHWLIFFRKGDPETTQRAIFFAVILLLLLIEAVYLYFGLPRGMHFLLLGIILFVLLAGYLVFVKKRAAIRGAATGKEPGAVKLVYGKRWISKSYRVNLFWNEVVMASLAIMGVLLWYILPVPYWATRVGFALLWIGGFGILLAPAWCVFILTPAFFDKTREQLKGTILKGERFIGGIVGTALPGRPKIAVESTDNALFVTNNRVMAVTIPGLAFGPQVEETGPFVKTSMYRFLQQKAQALLRKSPNEVLWAHDFTFSIPFSTLRKVQFVSNPLFRAMGMNIVRFRTVDGDIPFSVTFHEDFAKLHVLLRTVIPEKVAQSFI